MRMVSHKKHNPPKTGQGDSPRLLSHFLRSLWLVLLVAAPCAAQCAMCRASVANGENAAEMSYTINSAVLVLFFPTLAIIGGFVGLVLKYRHSKGGEMEERRDTEDPTS